jgi:mRNA-degrading endonuclease RelE of RelBE toxin-antitoxin system
MYKEKYHPKIKKDTKKLDFSIAEVIKTKYIPEILSNPEIGEVLVGDLSGIRAYHFKIGKQQYRIAYIANEELRTVYFLMIGKRGDFYTLLKRRLR